MIIDHGQTRVGAAQLREDRQAVFLAEAQIEEGHVERRFQHLPQRSRTALDRDDLVPVRFQRPGTSSG